ncbi:hypothetical protein U0070_006896, partial [Myodes glareolus]
VESNKSSSATLPPNMPSYRSLSSREDCPSSHTSFSDGELARNVREGVKHRIFYLSEQLRVEKASRDENTMSYLKLVSKADRHQAPHIRQAFERVNQRTSATIAHIERKLYQCHLQLKELEEGCSPTSSVLKVESAVDNHKQPGEKVSYSKLSKTGGKDNLPNNIARPYTLESHLSGMQQRKFSDKTYVAQQRKLLLQKMKEELTEVRKVHAGLQVSHQSFKESHVTDVREILESLQEKKTRQSLMEEQVNDHLQRYLDEICHLKQRLACTEEKMAYLSYERAKEIWIGGAVHKADQTHEKTIPRVASFASNLTLPKGLQTTSHLSQEMMARDQRPVMPMVSNCQVHQNPVQRMAQLLESHGGYQHKSISEDRRNDHKDHPGA